MCEHELYALGERVAGVFSCPGFTQLRGSGGSGDENARGYVEGGGSGNENRLMLFSNMSAVTCKPAGLAVVILCFFWRNSHGEVLLQKSDATSKFLPVVINTWGPPFTNATSEGTL